MAFSPFRYLFITLIILLTLHLPVFLLAETEIPLIEQDKPKPTLQVKTTAKTGATVNKKPTKKKPGCSTFASARYRAMLQNWNKVPKIPAIKYQDGYRELVLYAVNFGERIRFFPYLVDGELDPEALSMVKRLLRDKDNSQEHNIEPRLLKLLYKIADHFKAKQINIISGYRTSTDEKKESKHTQGAAADFMIPGKSLGAVAAYARTLGHVGVGFYPVSGFVHLDVRDGPSYFWIDRSGPGKPSCIRHILNKAAAKYDCKWKAENDEPKKRSEPQLKAKPKHQPVKGTSVSDNLNAEFRL